MAWFFIQTGAPAQNESADGFEIFERTGFTVGETPTAPAVEMDEIENQSAGMVREKNFDRLIDGVRMLRADFRETTGLSFSGFYTAVGQAATNSTGRSVAGSGDLDLLARWKVRGASTGNPGEMIFDAEYRHAIGDLPASAMAVESGLLTGTVNGFNDRGMVIRNFHFIQRLADGRFGFLIGRTDPSDMGGGHAMQNSNTMFLNRAFSSAPTVAYPGFGISAGLSVRPVSWFYVTAGGTNAHGNTITNDLPELGGGDFFTFLETGFTPGMGTDRAGRYRVCFWNLDAPSGAAGDSGFSAILDRELGPAWQVFGRFGWSRRGVSGAKSSGQIGAGWRDWGTRGNLAGLALAVSEAPAGGRCETVLEVFARLQVNSITQATFGIQGIGNPVYSGDPAAAVLSGRLRVAF